MIGEKYEEAAQLSKDTLEFLNNPVLKSDKYGNKNCVAKKLLDTWSYFIRDVAEYVYTAELKKSDYVAGVLNYSDINSILQSKSIALKASLIALHLKKMMQYKNTSEQAENFIRGLTFEAVSPGSFDFLLELVSKDPAIKAFADSIKQAFASSQADV